MNSKLKAFLIVFLISTTVAFVMRDENSNWPMIIFVNVCVAAVAALLDKAATNLGRTIVNKIFGHHQQKEKKN